MHLHEEIAVRVKRWREGGYPSDHLTIAEIFEYATDEGGTLRYLRLPQFHALETYWYLRLLEGAPHVFELYKSLHKKQSELLAALGLDQDGIRNHRVGQAVDDQETLSYGVCRRNGGGFKSGTRPDTFRRGGVCIFTLFEVLGRS